VLFWVTLPCIIKSVLGSSRVWCSSCTIFYYDLAHTIQHFWNPNPRFLALPFAVPPATRKVCHIQPVGNGGVAGGNGFRSPFCTCTWPGPFWAISIYIRSILARLAALLLGRLYEILIDLSLHLPPLPLQWYKVQSAIGKWNYTTTWQLDKRREQATAKPATKWQTAKVQCS